MTLSTPTREPEGTVTLDLEDLTHPKPIVKGPPKASRKRPSGFIVTGGGTDDPSHSPMGREIV